MTTGEIDLVVIEATENYDWLLVELLHEHQIDGVVANPDQVHEFIRGVGQLGRNDGVDARSQVQWSRTAR